MATPFIEIDTAEALDQFLAAANGSPAILFKHSNTCGVSARAYGEMSKLEMPVGLITVQRARRLSDEIEQRWQVAHESPQVLVIRGGQAVWDAAHSRGKAEEVAAGVAAAAQAPTP